MTLAPTVGSTTAPAPAPAGARARRRERARLARLDRRGAHLAELHHIGLLTRRAVALVESGWVQHAWFAVEDGRGRRLALTAPGASLLADHPVVGGCLVGALVQAGGGLEAVSTQLVQRTLDLTWHTLAGDERQPVRWGPAPAERVRNLRDLTRWNDHPARGRGEVTGLLRSVERAAAREAARVRTSGS
jgi:hypothetical protein